MEKEIAYMPVLDWSSTAAWLGIFLTLSISIIAPIINTYLNNKFQLTLKEKELQYEELKDISAKKYSAYEGFLQITGKYLQAHNYDNRSVLGTYLYELYLYLPNEHWKHLDELINAINHSEWITAEKEFIEISKILSADLASSKLTINLKEECSPCEHFTNKKTSNP